MNFTGKTALVTGASDEASCISGQNIQIDVAEKSSKGET